MGVSTVSQYLNAVGREKMWGASPLSKFAPPMAITALAMTAMTELFKMPDGAVHTAEELEFHKAVPVGTKLTSHAKVGRKLDRGKFHMAVIELNITDEENETVITGKASIVLTNQKMEAE